MWAQAHKSIRALKCSPPIAKTLFSALMDNLRNYKLAFIVLLKSVFLFFLFVTNLTDFQLIRWLICVRSAQEVLDVIQTATHGGWWILPVWKQVGLIIPGGNNITAVKDKRSHRPQIRSTAFRVWHSLLLFLRLEHSACCCFCLIFRPCRFQLFHRIVKEQ